MNGSNFNTKKFLVPDARQVDQIKENLDASISSKNKITEETNRDLLDTFLNTKNSIHIEKQSEDVKIQREHQDTAGTKVKVISGIDSKITFNRDVLKLKDHPEIYKEYNAIIKDQNLDEETKQKKLEFLDRLIASRSSLMTANHSIMYTFKRRIYFSTAENRNHIFDTLNKVEPFKDKIESMDQDMSGKMHFIIKRKDEIEKRKDNPKEKKIRPTKPSKEIKEKETETETKIDIDTDAKGKSEAKATATAKSSIENSGNITQKVEVNNDAIAEAMKEINKQNQKTIEMLIQILNDNKNTVKQTNTQEVNINGGGANYMPINGTNNYIPYFGAIPGGFYNAFNTNNNFMQFMAMLMQQQNSNNNNNNINVNGGNKENNEVNIALMMQEMFKNLKLELIQEINNKYGDININIDKSYKKIKNIIKNIDINNTTPEEIRKIIIEELQPFKISIVNEIKTEINTIKIETNADLKKLEEKIDTGFSDMREKFKEMKEYLDNRFNILEGKLKDIEGKIDAIQLKLELMDGKIDTILEELKKLHEEHEKIMEELAGIKKMIEECCNSKSESDDDREEIDPFGTGFSRANEIQQEAVISNVTEVSREEAEKIAENELREKYGEMSWLNPKRYWYFYAREYITKNKVQAIMSKDGRKGLNWDDKFVAGADRHGLELATGMDDIDSILEITQDNYPNTHNRINQLARDYIGNPPYTGTMSRDAFHNAFKGIIESSPPLDNTRPGIQKIMEQNNMQKVSSNIFNQVDAFRANKELVYDMTEFINNTHPNTDNFSSRYRPKIAEYIKNYTSMPAFMKRFEEITGKKLSLDNPEMYNNLLRHHVALGNIQADTLRLNVKLINRGRSAYKVDQNHGAMTKMGKWLDRPFAKWIDTSENGLARTGKNTLSILTKAAFQAGPVAGLGFLGGSLIGGPLGAPIGVGIAVGAKTLFAKFAHTTKEHEGHLRDQSRNLDDTQAYRDRIREAYNQGEYKRYHRFTPNRKGVEYRNFLRYIKTSHQDLKNSKIITDNIMNLAQKGISLTDIEKNTLRDELGRALARLDLYKQTGQNFLGSVEEISSEKEFRDIKKAIMLGAARLGDSLEGLRNSQGYQGEKPILREQYDQAWESFKKKRRSLARSGAIKTGVIAGGMSYTLSRFLPKTETISGTNEVEKTMETSGNRDPSINIEDQFIQGDVDAPLRATIGNPDYGSGAFEITAGVDELVYNNVAGAKAELGTKLPLVKNYIKTHFSGSNQQTLLDALDPDILRKIQTDAVNAGVDKGNSYLLANRYVEGLEEIAHAHVDAGNTASPITEITNNIIHQPSVARASGNLDYRTMGVKMKYINIDKWEKIVKTNRTWMPGDWVDNTFKMGNSQEDEAPTT